MGLAVLAVLGGLVLLTLASDRFVMGTARIALALRISPVVVGAVIIGFGTSAPELLISGLAAGQGLVGIAVGNIVGSNIANLTLVLGTAALIFPLRATSRTLRRELPLSCLAVFAFALAAQGSLKPVEGVVLLATIVAVLWWLVSSARRDRRLTEEVEEFVGETPSRISLPRESLRTLLGLAGTLAGAQLLVTGARDVAGPGDQELGAGQGPGQPEQRAER
ncbi:MAG: sodium:calcium antiporter, partial [Actinobacteria bacterium]|nr:sodium:calcium antiporter [Actinomycetota bacterium]